MTGAIAEVRRSLSASDDATLIEGFAERVRRDRMATAELVAHVEEIDRRELWARHGCSSMFSFCTDRFHISESQAGRLIWAARTARRFPVIFDMLAGGDVHLTTINTLAAYLTDENHRDVLSRARHLKKRELERLVAEIAPRPDVPSRVVALPRPRDAGTAPASLLALDAVVEKAMETPPPSSASPARPAGRVEPLSPRRFKIEVTVDEDTHDALRELQDLLSHQIPNGDPAAIVARALNELLERTRAKRAAKTDRPKARKNDVATPARTRHVPAAARRKTWEDSGGRSRTCRPTDIDAPRGASSRSITSSPSRAAAPTTARTPSSSVARTTSTKPIATTGGRSWTPSVVRRTAFESHCPSTRAARRRTAVANVATAH